MKMNNGNEPINAIESQHGFCTGLTKREHFAGLAMQGLLSANAMYSNKTDNREALARDAISHADALLKEL